MTDEPQAECIRLDLAMMLCTRQITIQSYVKSFCYDAVHLHGYNVLGRVSVAVSRKIWGPFSV